jgi:hypothetical protein
VLKPPRLVICLLGGLAVLASGCGSTKTASTRTTARVSTSGAATAPASKAAQTATQSTSSKPAPKPAVAAAKPEHREKAAAAKPEHEQNAAKRSVEAVKPKAGSGEQVPRSRRYPRFLQLKFIVSCEAAKGSNSSCECILTKLERSDVEKGHSLAELIALELTFKEGASFEAVVHHRVALPLAVQRDAAECGSRTT